MSAEYTTNSTGSTSDSSSPWHVMSIAEAAQRLDTDVHRGLSQAQVVHRIDDYGPNVIARGRRRSLWRLFIAQFTDFMILVLLGAAAVSGIVGEPLDALAIIVIVVLNAIVGVVQAYRAERAIGALRAMGAPRARVRREGRVVDIPSEQLVPGDIVLLSAGNVVPADLRLFEGAELKLDEAALTGESQAVSKQIDALTDAQAPLAERTNMLYKGTQIGQGRGLGLVVATGMQSELGRIAALLREERGEKTPLQKRLTRFGKRLALIILGISGIIFAVGALRGEPLMLMFLTAVSLAVAAIPEALPAVVTVSLALGARIMSRRHALIRRLPAVETLGSVTYICSDKTGTLTRNKMTAEAFWSADELRDALPAPEAAAEHWRCMGQVLALNNDIEADARGHLLGDPTELALYQAAGEAGYERKGLTEAMPRVAEVPFDAERKLMSTVHLDADKIRVFVKGAPERLLAHCKRRMSVDGTLPLDPQAMLDVAGELAAKGYRVLAVAVRSLDELPETISGEALEQDLIFVGLVGLIDPPRPEVPAAVADCARAGITPVMITGDHPGTALAIAARVGITGEDAPVLSGRELDKLSDTQLRKAVDTVRVYARVTPEQKIRIVKALQDNGEFAAMTGDGVNDAPSLKRADIGVAMGKKGTDVAREAADMILLDDNFATIVTAIHEGRRIYDNIRKFIKYTMTSNSGEIWTLFLAPFLGLPLPLLPLQILWINLITDSLPGLALAAEPEEPGAMRRPPRPPGESVFAHGMWQHILWVGLLIGGLSLLTQAWAIHTNKAHWQTMVFTVLTFSQLFHVLAIRSQDRSLFSIGFWSNPALLLALAVTFLLQLGVIYLPFLQGAFNTAALSGSELGACLALSSVVLLAVEAEKWLARHGRLYREATE